MSESPSTEIIQAGAPAVDLTRWTPRLEISVDEAVAIVKQREEFLTKVLRKGIDYGVIPGTGTKPTLYKPGAERVLAGMMLHAELVNDEPPVLDFEGTEEHGKEPFIFYQRRCNVYRQIGPDTEDRMLVASASGSCSSREKKYRYRNAERTCPNCGTSNIIKGKAEYGGGWICFAKKGGCGAKFDDKDKTIIDQKLGQVLNPDIADVANTILKMADKRALVAAAIMATGYSDYLTQDLEDTHGGVDDEPPPEDEQGTTAAKPAKAAQKAQKAEPAPTPAPAAPVQQAAPAPPQQADPAPAPEPEVIEAQNTYVTRLRDLMDKGRHDSGDGPWKKMLGTAIKELDIDRDQFKAMMVAGKGDWVSQLPENKAKDLFEMLLPIVDPEAAVAAMELPV